MILWFSESLKEGLLVGIFMTHFHKIPWAMEVQMACCKMLLFCENLINEPTVRLSTKVHTHEIIIPRYTVAVRIVSTC